MSQVRARGVWHVCAVAALVLLWPVAVLGQSPLRVALVPLDDRPVCTQYPEMMAGLAHAELGLPPRALLGRFTTPGDTQALAQSLASQALDGVDAFIVSVDMLAYGGLVASRVHDVDADTALASLDQVRDIRRRHPRLPIYGFSVIMRLAPTADGTNETWRVPLARWAEISPSAGDDPDLAAEVADLVATIPADALAAYQRARTRNLRVNRAALDLVDEGVFTHLVLAQDDAKPRGVHVADREALVAEIRQRGLTDRVSLQPGADEVAMLLLSRAVLREQALAPTVHAIYSSEAARVMVAPFEDRPLHETVSGQLRTAGALETDDSAAADLLLFVYADRHGAEAPSVFASTIVDAVNAGRRVIVADVDPRGDVQGASPPFTEALLSRDVLPRLYGYASWNTAGNTIGTAIPHGLLFHAGVEQSTRCASPVWHHVAEAQTTFLLHRLVNDYAYQGVARERLNRQLRRQRRTSDWVREHLADIERRLVRELTPQLRRLAQRFTRRPMPLGIPAEAVLDTYVRAVDRLSITLPWARTFEAHITFDVTLETRPRAGARQRPVCESPP